MIEWFDKMFERRKEQNRNKLVENHRRKKDVERMENEIDEAFKSKVINIKRNAQNTN